MKSRLITFFSEVYSYRQVLYQLVTQQLILRYRRTALGYLWTLINPLLMMSVMAVVFSTLFKVELKTFAILLFAGMVPWNFFSSVVAQTGASFINNEGLIKKIYLPKAIFPLSVVIALFIDSLLSFVALFAIILTIGGTVSWSVLFVSYAYIILFVLSFGISLIVSVATVYFRDLQYIVGIAMQGLFFLTPILYKKDSLVGKLSFLVKINPLTPFIDLFRSPIYLGTLPPIATIMSSFIISISFLAVGLVIFICHEKKLVFRL